LREGMDLSRQGVCERPGELNLQICKPAN